MILKLFRAVTVGIVNALVPFMVALLSISIPYAPINPSKTALSHPLFVGRGSACALWVSHPCETLGTHAKASLPLYERSVGFASLQSLCAFISGFLALLAPPVAPTSPFLQPLQKNTYHLPFLPFPLHRPSLFLQPSQKHIHRLAPC